MITKRFFLFYLITAAVLVLFILWPKAAALWYGEIYFPVVAHFSRSVSHYLHPNPLVPTLVVLLPGLFFLLLVKSTSVVHLLQRFAHSLATLACLFFWCWGFFYTFPPMVKSEAVKETLPLQEVFNFGVHITEHIQRSPAAKVIPHDTLCMAVGQFLNENNRCYAPTQSARCRVLHDGGLLYRIGISGIYFPFTGEAYTTAMLPTFSQHFVIAHELSHALGITDEGEADYTAYRALKKIQTREANYAADLELLLTVRSALKQNNDSLWGLLVQKTPLEVNADILYLRWKRIQHPDALYGSGSSMNNLYLKTLGVKDGIKSYDRLLQLAYADYANEPL